MKKGYIYREGKQWFAYLGEVMFFTGNLSIFLILSVKENEFELFPLISLIISYFLGGVLIPIKLFKSIKCKKCKNQYLYHHIKRCLNFEVKSYGYNPYKDDFCDQCNPEKRLSKSKIEN
jgi:hypothetical protein